MHYYDQHPLLRPPKPDQNQQRVDGGSVPLMQVPARIELSAQEEAQIQEIFDLFDTDGGGVIDREELEAAMFALGFHSRSHSGKGKETELERLGGSVNLNQFKAMMKGELSGESPVDDVLFAFDVLCRLGQTEEAEPGERGGAHAGASGGVTLGGLRRACRRFDVRLSEDELRLMMEDSVAAGGAMDARGFLLIMGESPWF